MNDSNLNKRAFGGLAFLVFTLAVLIFLPAWTLVYWQAWVFLAVFATMVSNELKGSEYGDKLNNNNNRTADVIIYFAARSEEN